MNALNFRTPIDAIDDLDDESLCEAATDLIWPDLLVQDELKHIAQGTLGQQAVYTATIFAREVDNGGFWQFFHNSSGMYWRHVRDGLELVGAEEHAEVFAVALKGFSGGEPPLDERERREILDEIYDSYKISVRSLEDRIYKLGGFETTLRPYWAAYIREHPDEFFLLNH